MAWSLLLAWANSPALSITRDQLMLACIRPYFMARYEAVSALIRDTKRWLEFYVFRMDLVNMLCLGISVL